MKYLIAGLGNIGEEYRNTRHNVGFLMVDALAESGAVAFSSARYGAMADMRFRGRILKILKPSTYMNLSGKAVKYWLNKENIPLDNLLVITDDIDLNMGILRMKSKGSGGSHNGLNNIIEELGTSQFPRLRFGIGHDFERGEQVDYVLGHWTEEEKNIIATKKNIAVEMVKSFVMAGINLTMSRYNNK
ncbi:MAG: aminoacyl-tRNA hydrolase [Bacteroidales bacterium]|jgi:PTH1 family peptidyl-tRNA hydrolase|nr:aminoacyl-tRNA hydrolase [Bacteroidales bacterium]